MTVSSSTNKNTYAGDDSTTAFAFSFAILAETHFAIQEVNDTTGVVTTKTITTHYTVSGTGNDTGSTNYTSGTITMVTAPATGVTLVVKRAMPFTQDTDYVENDVFPAESHEEALDELTMMAQEQSETIGQSLKLPSSLSATTEITAGALTADTFLKVDAAGTGFEFATGTTAALVDDTTPQLGGDLDLNSSDITGTGNINHTGTLTTSGVATIGGNLSVAADIIHTGDTNNKIGFTTDTQTFTTGGSTRADITDSGVQLGGSGARVTTVLDEDAMGTDSATALATQQSIKAYVDAVDTDVVNDTTPQLGGNLDTNANNIAFDDTKGIIDESGNEQLMFQTTASATNYVEITNAATGGSPQALFTGSDAAVNGVVEAKGAGDILFKNNSTSAGGLTDVSGVGYWKFTTTGSYNGASSQRHEFLQSVNNNSTVRFDHTGNSTPYGIDIAFTGAAPDDSTRHFLYCYDTAGAKFKITSNGNVQFGDGKGLDDDAGNRVLRCGKTASAVNYGHLTNAATGNSPVFRSNGSDTDIALTFRTKAAGAMHFESDTTGGAAFNLTNDSATPRGIRLGFDSASPDDNSQYFLWCQDSTTARCYIYSDGDLQNHDNSYGAISDVRLKQDIVDAKSQWDDIKALRIKKYRMITDVEAYGDDATVQLGVIAQEVEEDGMGGLVRYNEERDEYGVQYSVMYMKAVKALQEAQLRIEKLEKAKTALKKANATLTVNQAAILTRLDALESK